MALQQRYNVLTGAAAEEQWCNELARHGGLAWSVKANTDPRFNKDIYGFDVLCLTPGEVLLCQVKATADDPWPPSRFWRARFLALLPHPPGVRYMLVWLTPAGAWRTWRLLSDGTRLELEWPPVGVGSAS